MNTNKYRKEHLILTAIQIVFIVLGWGNALYQSLANVNVTKDIPAIFNTLYSVTSLSFFWLVMYAMWGYKRSIVPMRLAILSFYTMLVVFLHDMGGLNIKLEPTADCFVFVLTAVSFIALIVFDNTFKKHKKYALIAGGIFTATEFVCMIIRITVLGKVSFIEFLSCQPFAGFFIAGAIFATYLARWHWSVNGKIEEPED